MVISKVQEIATSASLLSCLRLTIAIVCTFLLKKWHNSKDNLGAFNHDYYFCLNLTVRSLGVHPCSSIIFGTPWQQHIRYNEAIRHSPDSFWPSCGPRF